MGTAAALILTGLAPFLVYAGIKIGATSAPEPWPANVAIVTSNHGTLLTLSLLHPGSRAIRESLPVETALNTPDAGTLRAASVFRIGGASLLAQALSNTVRQPVPYFAEWRAVETGSAPTRTNLGEHVAPALAMLRDPATATEKAPGRFVNRLGIDYFQLNLNAMLDQLSTGGVTTPSPTFTAPSPRTSLSPVPASKKPSIEIVNEGASEDANSVATDLRTAGFTSVTVIKGTDSSIRGVRIFYSTLQSSGDSVAAAITSVSVTSVRKRPADLNTKADVMILVGPATARPTTPPSPPAKKKKKRTTASPSPSSVVLH